MRESILVVLMYDETKETQRRPILGQHTSLA